MDLITLGALGACLCGTAFSGPARQSAAPFASVLAHLHALRWVYWTEHWTAGGATSYADHLLFGRLYKDLDTPIDELGERLVAFFGPASVDAAKVQRASSALIERQASRGVNRVQALLQLERGAARAIFAAWQTTRASETGRLGLDDYLMGLAKDRDTAVYLLRQRAVGMGDRPRPSAG
jgi:DNA-binding ferritin-like protein